jgi:uncharacterized protein (TIGR03032 family)
MTATQPLTVSYSDGLGRWLSDHDTSIAFTTAPTGRVVFVGLEANGAVSLFERPFDGATALWARGDTLLAATAFQIWRFDNALADGEVADGYDRLYVPQAAYTTGDIGAGDLALARNGAIVFVSRLFNCLAVASEAFSFAPLWRPDFISDLVPEDRCHVSGMTLVDGAPRVVTVGARVDIAAGWQAEAVGGGAVIDVRTDAVVADGLSLPAAPRFHRDRLWLLDTATGWFGFVDPRSRRFERLTFCPGLPRALDMVGDYAVCAVAPDATLAGAGLLPVAETLDRHAIPARCAVLIVDTVSGQVAEWLQVDGGADDVAGLALLPGVRRPAAIGLDGADIHRVLSIAPEAPRRSAPREDTIPVAAS